MLELLGLKPEYKRIDITKGEQSSEEYLKITPYAKVPAITDVDPNTGDKINIFESGALLQFIASKYDTDFKYHYPQDHPLYWEQQKWFFFSTSSISPRQGELSFYLNFASKQEPFAIERANIEAKKVYKTLEARLIENNGWLVGDKLNIAEISAFPFVRRYDFVKINLENEFPNVYAWVSKLKKIDGLERAYSYIN